MKIAMACDHAGFEYKEALKTFLEELGHTVQDCGTDSTESVDYPDYAVKAARAVAEARAEAGILICGSGIGVSISANKIQGIRAANCLTVEMAKLSRQHNNANILTLGSRLVSLDSAREIAMAFLATDFEGGRHSSRVEKIHTLSGC